MTTHTISADDADALAVALDGRVWRPGDASYEQETAGFNAAVRHRADLVAGVSSAAEIAEVVRLAGRRGVRVAVQATGHSAPPADGGILITTTRMQGVEIDSVARTATVEAGVRWGAVLEAAAPHGLTAVTGSAPSVGVVGMLLGGGIGPLARTLGIASDRVRSFRIVTADGVVRDVDATTDPELFWALRGGKRGFGIVTAVTVELLELSEIVGGALWFAAGDARRVLTAWTAAVPSLPDSVTTSIAMLRLPPLPELPEPLRGQFAVAVRIGAPFDGAAALAFADELRAVAPRLIDAVGTLPAHAVGAIHSDPAEPMPTYEAGALLSGFDESAAQVLLDAAGPERDVPLAVIEIRQFGGAMQRALEGGDAVGGRDAAFSVLAIGAPVAELIDTVIPQVAHGVLQALGPWATGRTQANFQGTAGPEWRESLAWPDDTYERIVRMRQRIDPAGMFA